MFADHGSACGSALRRVDRVLALCVEGNSQSCSDVSTVFVGSGQQRASITYTLNIDRGWRIQGTRVQPEFEFMDIKLIRTQESVYVLKDNAGFAEWAYLFFPGEFQQVIKDYPAFLISSSVSLQPVQDMAVHQCKDMAILNLVVNHVEQLPSGFGVEENKNYLVIFEPDIGTSG